MYCCENLFKCLLFNKLQIFKFLAKKVHHPVNIICAERYSCYLRTKFMFCQLSTYFPKVSIVGVLYIAVRWTASIELTAFIK